MASTWNLYDPKPDTIATAEELVTERWNQIEQWLEKYEDEFRSSIADLKKAFDQSNFPAAINEVQGTIDYDYIDGEELDFDLPEKPEAPDFDYEPPDPPQKIAELKQFTMQDIEAFNEALEEVEEPSIEFMEQVYQSGLLDELKDKLKELLESGGTGLGEEVEDQIWQRAKAKKDLENERVYREAEQYFAARGYTLPPGALAGRLFEALQEQTRADNQMAAEIGIEQARLAQNETQHIRNMSLQLEQLDQDTHNRIQQRAYEKVRDAAAVIQKAYDQKIAAFQAKVDAHRSNAETERIKAEAVSTYNRGIVDVYNADMTAYSTQVQAELGIVETIGQIFASKISGYTAEVDAKSKKLQGQIEQFRAKIQQSNNQTSLSLQEAEMLLTKYIEGLRLESETEGSHANILAQIVSSLYNAVSISGRLSEGLNYSKSLNGESDPDVSVHYNFSDR